MVFNSLTQCKLNHWSQGKQLVLFPETSSLKVKKITASIGISNYKCFVTWLELTYSLIREGEAEVRSKLWLVGEWATFTCKLKFSHCQVTIT